MRVNPYGWADVHTTFTNSVKPPVFTAKTLKTDQCITRERFEQMFYDLKADRLSFEKHYRVGTYIDILI